ncbi:hypothetical protein DVH24_015856 [Malus domestica]|uniref:Uncharacterized protein n=1 Tax=Malus domestica TaxID=3750 RepID=A0A498JD81_MALDO|nr:hypothetical protein DVH24_015856 [Malus domestica]
MEMASFYEASIFRGQHGILFLTKSIMCRREISKQNCRRWLKGPVQIMAMLVPISRLNSIVSVIRNEAAQVHAGVSNGHEICEAGRIQPYLVDADGHAFWKLKGNFGEDILLQVFELFRCNNFVVKYFTDLWSGVCNDLSSFEHLGSWVARICWRRCSRNICSHRFSLLQSLIYQV